MLGNVKLRGGGSEGGRGTRNIYWWGVPWHTKEGGLICGHSPKREVLGAGTTRIRGVYNPKKREFRTGCVRREGDRN